MATIPAINECDAAYMTAALRLAKRGLGNVWPNPAVGCLLVREGVVVGRGWTQPGGRPHAETVALSQAGKAAHGATAYITLEPCCHWGKTPPCTDALISAGVMRVVVAIEDKDPRMSGQGVLRLRQAGVSVTTNVAVAEARQINAGFFSVLERKHPWVALKLGSSLDGRIATGTGESRWITGSQARRAVHLMRQCFDAIMVGSSTVAHDDPELTCRLPGLPFRPPVRVVVDGQLRLSLSSRLVRSTAEAPLWLVTGDWHGDSVLAPYRQAGVDIIRVSRQPGSSFLDLESTLHCLAQKGLTRVMVEGGGKIAASLLKDDLVDRIVWFRAPSILGAEGQPAIAELGVAQLAMAPSFVRCSVEPIGADSVEILDRKRDNA